MIFLPAPDQESNPRPVLSQGRVPVPLGHSAVQTMPTNHVIVSHTNENKICRRWICRNPTIQASSLKHRSQHIRHHEGEAGLGEVPEWVKFSPATLDYMMIDSSNGSAMLQHLRSEYIAFWNQLVPTVQGQIQQLQRPTPDSSASIGPGAYGKTSVSILATVCVVLLLLFLMTLGLLIRLRSKHLKLIQTQLAARIWDQAEQNEIELIRKDRLIRAKTCHMQIGFWQDTILASQGNSRTHFYTFIVVTAPLLWFWTALGVGFCGWNSLEILTFNHFYVSKNASFLAPCESSNMHPIWSLDVTRSDHWTSPNLILGRHPTWPLDVTGSYTLGRHPIWPLDFTRSGVWSSPDLPTLIGMATRSESSDP